MSEHQTPARFQIAPDPQTAHLPLDHPIRRRSMLLSLAGAAALQACGGDVVGSGDDAAGADGAAVADDQMMTKGASAQVASAHAVEPYGWTNLVPMNMYERLPLPVMDGCGLLSFKGYLWLIGGWWPYPLKVVRETVNGVERIVRKEDGSIAYHGSDYAAQGFIKNTTNAVWRSLDGVKWENVKPDTYNTDGFKPPPLDWEGRHAFGCVVFQNRMWIIGGDMQHIGLDLPSPLTSENYSESSPPPQDAPVQNDIWSSEDGINWRYEGNLPFVHKDKNTSTRMCHSVLVFNNALWLIGGFAEDSVTHFNDVWKSTDGKTWDQVLANMPNPPAVAVGATGRWTPRTVYGHTVVHANRMWILGGALYGQSYFNDVWSSADGEDWRLELANDSSLDNVTRWMGRIFAQTASFDGKMWIFTGANRNKRAARREPLTWECRQGEIPPPGCQDSTDWNLNGDQRDLWYSTDGKQWRKYSQGMVDPRHAAAAVVHRNALVVATGGWNDCWMFSPYVWEKVPQRQTPHYGLSDARAAVSADGKIWLLGGYVYLPNNTAITSNEVWSSPNGGDWTLVKADTYNKLGFNASRDWRGRNMQSAVHLNGKLWVVGGAHLQSTYLDDVWNSADGKVWARVSSGVKCLKRVLHTVVKFKAVGDTAESIWVLGGQNAVDGLNLPMPEGRLVHYNDVWKSVDGKTWKQVTAKAQWAGRGLIAGAVVFKDRMWVIGGARYRAQGQGDSYFNDVWSSADGKTWKLETASAPWSARGHHAVCVFDKRMWVIGGYAFGPKADIWSSDDGVNWAQLPLPKPGDAEGAGFDCSVVVHLGVPHLIMGRGGQTAGARTDVWRLKLRDRLV